MAPPIKTKHVLAALCKAAEIGEQQLAAHADCSESYIRAIKQRRRNLTRKLAMRLALETGVSQDWLIAGDHDKPPLTYNGEPFTRQFYDRWRKHREEQPVSNSESMEALWKEGQTICAQGDPLPLDFTGKLAELEPQIHLGPKTVFALENGKQVPMPPESAGLIAKEIENIVMANLARQERLKLITRFILTITEAFSSRDRDTIYWNVSEFIKTLSEKYKLDVPEDFSERQIDDFIALLKYERKRLKQKSEQSSKSDKIPEA